MSVQQPDISSLLNECRFEATRSSGKGGQNVNKVSTKVILLFDVYASQVLEETQKQVIFHTLQSRISKEGVFRITSGRERSQAANRKRVIEKFISLLEQAFEPVEERILTEPTQGSKVRRRVDKKNVSVKKSHRSSNLLTKLINNAEFE